jgi:hypothetical protein
VVDRNDFILPPKIAEASSTVTLIPFDLRISAAYSPAAPAPITATEPEYFTSGPVLSFLQDIKSCGMNNPAETPQPRLFNAFRLSTVFSFHER